jgi:hypothetical protein
LRKSCSSLQWCHQIPRRGIVAPLFSNRPFRASTAVPRISFKTAASESLLMADGIRGGMNHGNAEKENAQSNPEDF